MNPYRVIGWSLAGMCAAACAIALCFAIMFGFGVFEALTRAGL